MLRDELRAAAHEGRVARLDEAYQWVRDNEDKWITQMREAARLGNSCTTIDLGLFFGDYRMSALNAWACKNGLTVSPVESEGPARVYKFCWE